MKSISFVLTLLLSSTLAAPFESTYSSLSAREEAGLFDDLKGGSLGPRASDDTVARATDDLDKFLASLGGKGDVKVPSKREEALLGLDGLPSILGGLTGGVTGGTGAVGGAAKGATDAVGGVTGDLTKELKEKLGDVTGSAGGLTKDVTDKLDGLTGKGSDKQKREEALLGLDGLLGLISGLTGDLTGGAGGSGAVGELTKGLTDKLGDVTGSAGGLTKDVTDKLDGLTGKGSDKQKREEALAGLPLGKILPLLKALGLGKREEAVTGLPGSIEDLLELLGLDKRGEKDLSKREKAILPIPLDEVLKILGGLTKSGKQGLGKREEAIAGLPSLDDLLKILGLDKRGEEGLSRREEAIVGLPVDAILDLLKSLGLSKRDGQELSEREVAGIGRILSLNLLPLTKGSGKRDVAEGSSIDRRDPIVLTPEIVEALLRQKLEAAKKGKDDIKGKASGKDKREVANHQALDDVTDEVKELLEALLGGAGKLPDSIKKAVEDTAGDAKDVAKDASGKAKDAVDAVDPST
ncbi:hypothetical protein NCS52_00063900 [Fusarium sp. LHS14.1]|nr:hypothetical protein NCS52_00063900 [Fusarium sp. LHS14.1]